MLRKKLLLLLLLVTLLVSVSTTTDNARACSGDLCNCGIEAQSCDEGCLSGPPENLQACRRACLRASIRCAKDCCSPGEGWPPEV